MVQNKTEFSTQQLAQTLGQTVTQQEFSDCIKQIEILQPSAGKLFWQTTDPSVGIYIILAGKVRLLDRTDNLIASLSTGTSFGELTLFPEEQFQPYAARASVNLKVGYIPGNCLRSLIRKYPSIGQHLHRQAVLWDLLLLFRQNPALNNAAYEGLMQIEPLLEQHNLQINKLPSSLLKDQQLWILRRGELLHTSGLKLTAGNIYALSQLPKGRGWQVTQPTQLYSLSRSHWETALQYVPQLAELDANNHPVTASEPVTFPQFTVEPKNQSQKKINKAYFPNPSVKIGHLWQQITRRYPFFEQQSASDCGAACLVMVGLYWGKRFSVNRLRDIANVDRNGSSLRGLAAAAESIGLRGLAAAAESIGFSTRPVKASLDKLAQQSLPAIVHWEGQHYIVVYEVRGDRVIVGDPAIGQRTLTHPEFTAGWTGYTLLLQPTALLKETKEASTPFWQFFELTKPHWLVLLEVFIASIFIQIFGLITPLFTQLLLDRVVVQRSELTLTAVGVGLVIFSLFRVAITGLRQYLLDHTANRVDLAFLELL